MAPVLEVADATATPSLPCFRMNAFWASEIFRGLHRPSLLSAERIRR